MPDFVFTPSLFYKHAKSPHWIWHDIYTDPALKCEISEFAEKLIDEGNIHEAEVIADFDYAEVATDDIEEAVEQTLGLMAAGAECIYQGGLRMDCDGVSHVGRPDLLEKRRGRSRFGDYYYAPVDIKNSREVKSTHRMQLTLYSMMLDEMQGYFPDEVAIINSNRGRVPFRVADEDRRDTLVTRDAILEIVRGKKPPLRLSSSYKETPWYEVCLKDAEKANDIALLYKLDHRSLDALRAAGVRTIQDAANMDIASLPAIAYASEDRLMRAKRQAQSLIDNEVIWQAKPQLPDAPLRLYFDIEGDPLLTVDYLLGVWVVEAGKESYFKYFLAKSIDQEREMWKSFLAWIDALPADFVVYHYATYEATNLRRLADQYGGSDRLGEFQSRLVDLARVVQESVILPLYFYSIKDIAKSKFVNYQWRHQKAGGAQSVFWYEQWLETDDHQILQNIIDYNEDDVIATEAVHQWLLTSFQQACG